MYIEEQRAVAKRMKSLYNLIYIYLYLVIKEFSFYLVCLLKGKRTFQ